MYMKNGKKIILMYSQLKIICNIKIKDYAKIYRIGIVPLINGPPTK